MAPTLEGAEVEFPERPCEEAFSHVEAGEVAVVREEAEHEASDGSEASSSVTQHLNFSIHMYFCLCLFYTFLYLVDSVDKGRGFQLKYVLVFMYVFVCVGRLYEKSVDFVSSSMCGAPYKCIIIG